MTHYLEVDYRRESLCQIILGLEKSIGYLKSKLELKGWYDGLWFLEESEPIYGLAFIAFQNYVNGSIKDFYDTTKNKISFYKLGTAPENFSKSYIELIIVLANFIKHKDDGLNEMTKQILEAFNFTEYDEIDKSPIFGGLDLLDEKWNLVNIMRQVFIWRQELLEGYKHSL
ncbi:MAG: hypothetical protein EOO99_12135 [Pedobacter sp.]|nr:MAG: hypothetical protein EOO99_12135 [Pedobacter sp.]